uniref:Lipase domain-containing protein n=1 Tax=Anopheles funestus TaxID=62324 RepID=A0A4Y0BKE1_ANOFN
MSKLIFLTALLCSIVGVARGVDLQDVLTTLTEVPLARLLDSFIVPAPRTTGFETLVPQRDIQLLCTNSWLPLFQNVSVDDINVTRKLNFSQPLSIVIHGWQDANYTLYNAMTLRHLRYVKNTNYCMVDWKPYADYAYEIAARKGVPVVADRLFKFLQYISVLNFPLEKVSLVGFSMGAQIAGLTGKLLPGRIGNIYALDPAGPLFSHPIDVGPTRRLAGTDAQYVQVISTSRYTVGFGPLVGTQNFLPNAGYHPQATCKVGIIGLAELANALVCSHQYAAKLFIDTLDPASVILGQKCNLVLGLRVCLLLPTDRLGYYSKRIPGNFYL